MPGTPNYPPDLGSVIKGLQRQARNAFTAGVSRVPYSAITGLVNLLGDLVVSGAGRLRVLATNGAVLLDAGRFDLGGTPVSGIAFRRSDGTIQLYAYSDDDGNGYIAIQDKAGNIIVSDDGASGEGLARPWLGYQAWPASYYTTPPVSITSATFVPAWIVSQECQHPLIEVQLYCVPGASSAFEVQLKDPFTGVVMAGPIAVSGAAQYVTLTGSHVAGTAFGAFFRADIEARRTSGTNGLGLFVAYSQGRQS
jgi:hypothetical protein